MLAPSEFHFLACGSQMTPMPTIADIRHANLLLLIGNERGGITRLAAKIERSHAQISQLKNRNKHSKSGEPREMGDDVARHIEAKLLLPEGWMDTPHTAAPYPLANEIAGPSELSSHEQAELESHIVKLSRLARSLQTDSTDAPDDDADEEVGGTLVGEIVLHLAKALEQLDSRRRDGIADAIARMLRMGPDRTEADVLNTWMGGITVPLKVNSSASVETVSRDDGLAAPLEPGIRQATRAAASPSEEQWESSSSSGRVVNTFGMTDEPEVYRSPTKGPIPKASKK